MSTSADQPVEPWRMSDAHLLHRLADLVETEARIAAERLAVIAEIDLRQVAVAAGAPNTAEWLRGRLHRSPDAARREVALANALRHRRAVTREALAGGVISETAARIITETLTAAPPTVPAEVLDGVEQVLVEQAGTLDARQLAKAAKHVAYCADPDGARALAAEENRLRRKRELHLTPVEEGWVSLRGMLDPEAGALLLAAIDPLCVPRPSTADGPDLRSHGQRGADALVDMAQLVIRSEHLPTQGRTPTTLLVTMPEQSLRADATEAGVLPTGQAISPGALRRLACDAAVIPAVLGSNSEILDLGRKTYTCPPHLRKALVLRDDGCAFPSCGRPWQWTDAHHIIFWRDGGTTELDNMVLLCGHHHRVVHDTTAGWSITPNTGAPPTFHPPAWLTQLVS